MDGFRTELWPSMYKKLYLNFYNNNRNAYIYTHVCTHRLDFYIPLIHSININPLLCDFRIYLHKLTSFTLPMSKLYKTYIHIALPFLCFMEFPSSSIQISS